METDRFEVAALTIQRAFKCYLKYSEDKYHKMMKEFFETQEKEIQKRKKNYGTSNIWEIAAIKKNNNEISDEEYKQILNVNSILSQYCN